MPSGGVGYDVTITIPTFAELPETRAAETPKKAIERIKEDVSAFRQKFKLDQLVVVSVASTEPPFALSEVHQNVARLRPALEWA